MDPLERLEFLFGVADQVVVFGPQVAVDDLDGLVDAAGRDALPDFPEAAASETVDEPVAGHRFDVGFEMDRHGILVRLNRGDSGGAAATGSNPVVADRHRGLGRHPRQIAARVGVVVGGHLLPVRLAQPLPC